MKRSGQRPPELLHFTDCGPRGQTLWNIDHTVCSALVVVKCATQSRRTISSGADEQAPRLRTDPTRAAAQQAWWVHKKWMEELYGLRNESAHEGTVDRKKRAWSAFEHLVISAFVFPLVVKILLEREGFYALTLEDGAYAKAVDKLLTADGWNRLPTDSASRWIKIVGKEVQDARFEKAFSKALSASPSAPKTS